MMGDGAQQTLASGTLPSTMTRRLLSAAALLASLGAAAGQGFVCDIPTEGCQNGMFNVEKCVCECIPPYCIWEYDGTCTLPSGNCGGNPWAACTRGVDCPWWINRLKDESCTTGPEVPPEVWDIYNNRQACCNVNFPYSSICNRKIGTSAPTKTPTLGPPREAEFEVIPLKFDLRGLPDDIRMRELKDETTTQLRRIFIRLQDRVEGLKISTIEEKVVLDRNLLKVLLRRVLKDVTLYFNVYVVRVDGKRFGPLIIAEIRRNYREIMEQLQAFADTKYFGADLDMNLCTSEGGGSDFSLCIKDSVEPPPPTVPAPTPIVFDSEPEDEDGGLAGWAIALIVIFVLVFVCCIGYFIFVSCSPRDDGRETTTAKTDIYFGSRSRASGHSSRRSRRKSGDGTGRTSRRSRRNSFSRRSRRNDDYDDDDDDEDDNAQLAITEQPFDDGSRDAEPPRQILAEAHQEEGSHLDLGDSYTANTRESRKSRKSHGTKKSSRSRKSARDPTMYVPGQEDKPDPDADVTLMLESGGDTGSRRYYLEEDPPLRPKRDPTMYVEGISVEDASLPSKYAEGQPDQTRGRDPSMYVDDESPWGSYRTQEPEER